MDTRSPGQHNPTQPTDQFGHIAYDDNELCHSGALISARSWRISAHGRELSWRRTSQVFSADTRSKRSNWRRSRKAGCR